MFCRFCGKENTDGAAFCSKCGKQIGNRTQETVPAKAEKKPLDKTMLIIIAMVVVFFIILSAIFHVVSGMRKDNGDTAEGVQQERGVDLSGVQVGDVITYGEYEQDGDLSNGKEPLEWDVVAKEDGRYLLLSHYVIDYMPYDDGRADDTIAANEQASGAFCTWADSTLRSWCNGTFYNDSFSEEEKNYICEVTNSTADWIEINDGKLGHNQVGYEAGKGGPDTQDRVFLLSVEEVRKYFANDIQDREDKLNPYQIYIPRLLASPTYYAIDQGCPTYSFAEAFYGVNLNADGYDERFGEDGVWNKYYYGNVHKDYTDFGQVTSYGFRSPGGFTDQTCFVFIRTMGDLTTFSAKDPEDKLGVRPAMWVAAH